jgi:hypothetical protein
LRVRGIPAQAARGAAKMGKGIPKVKSRSRLRPRFFL